MYSFHKPQPASGQNFLPEPALFPPGVLAALVRSVSVIGLALFAGLGLLLLAYLISPNELGSRLTEGQRGAVRLQVPGLSVDQMIPFEDSFLTIGPRQMEALEAATQHSFLEDLAPGWTLRLQGDGGRWQNYEVTGSDLLSPLELALLKRTDFGGIALVAVYEGDGPAATEDQSYVVFAEPSATAAP